jgi:hypothetical protein
LGNGKAEAQKSHADVTFHSSRLVYKGRAPLIYNRWSIRITCAYTWWYYISSSIIDIITPARTYQQPYDRMERGNSSSAPAVGNSVERMCCRWVAHSDPAGAGFAGL